MNEHLTMYFSTLKANACNFTLISCRLSMVMECIFIHNLNNYNLHVMHVGHDGEKWCHDITISTKLFKI